MRRVKDDQVVVLLNRIEHRLARFAEAMADVPSKIATLEHDVAQLKDDMAAVKAIGCTHSSENHEHRLTQLEAA